MSRIGRLPVVIPQGVTVTFADGVATVKGPLGTLSEEIKGHINLEIKGNEAIFTRDNEEKATKALHGLYRATLHNMVEGVTKGFEKHLMISGVGVKVTLQGTKLVMNPEPCRNRRQRHRQNRSRSMRGNYQSHQEG